MGHSWASTRVLLATHPPCRRCLSRAASQGHPMHARAACSSPPPRPSHALASTSPPQAPPNPTLTRTSVSPPVSPNLRRNMHTRCTHTHARTHTYTCPQACARGGLTPRPRSSRTAHGSSGCGGGGGPLVGGGGGGGDSASVGFGITPGDRPPLSRVGAGSRHCRRCRRGWCARCARRACVSVARAGVASGGVGAR